MIKSFLAAGTALVLSMGAAHAETIRIDNFQSPTAEVADNTADTIDVSQTDSYTLDGNAFTRTLSVSQTYNETDSLEVFSRATISEGRLRLSNDTEANGEFDLTYDINSIIGTFQGASDLFLRLLWNDLGIDPETNSDQPLLVELFLSDATGANFSMVGSEEITQEGLMDRVLEFALPALTDGQLLRLSFSGGVSFDSTFGPLALEVQGGDTEGEVPEPAAIGLLGLGLAGVAVARRRKARA